MKKLLKSYFDNCSWVSVDYYGNQSRMILGYILGFLFFPISFPIYSLFYWLNIES